MHLVLIGAALAAEPTISTAADGRTLVGVIEVEGDLAQAIALQQNPIQAAQVAGTDMTVTPGAKDGDCQLVHYKVNSVVMPLEYEARFCATETGYRSTLVGDGDLEEYTTEMHIEDLGGGRLRMTYHSLIAPRLPVPGYVMRYQMGKEICDFLRNTGAWLERF
ncbi:MAG: hypothetical protein H6740_17290 [Alphaproteobacteria bacterium]|nr:hypothetical protein [Alphaproteobacteria bacterium]